MTLSRIYIETCPLIDAIKFEVGSPVDASRDEDIWYTQTCLKSAFDGELEIITSTLTIAECRRAGEGPVSPETKRIINSILLSGRVILLAQITQSIAERARDFEWNDGISLGGADAIHLATAIKTGCKEFLTNDGRGPLKNADKIADLGISVIRPSKTKLLDPKRKQRALGGEKKLTSFLLNPNG